METSGQAEGRGPRCAVLQTVLQSCWKLGLLFEPIDSAHSTVLPRGHFQQDTTRGAAQTQTSIRSRTHLD